MPIGYGHRIKGQMEMTVSAVLAGIQSLHNYTLASLLIIYRYNFSTEHQLKSYDNAMVYLFRIITSISIQTGYRRDRGRDRERWLWFIQWRWWRGGSARHCAKSRLWIYYIQYIQYTPNIGSRVRITMDFNSNLSLTHSVSLSLSFHLALPTIVQNAHRKYKVTVVAKALSPNGSTLSLSLSLCVIHYTP